MTQLFFLLEHNLSPFQPILRGKGCSVFLPFEQEIGLTVKADDITIIATIEEQKKNFGIDRIIITKDTKFITNLSTSTVKLIILIDKTKRFELYQMKLNKICNKIISKAVEIVSKTQGQAVAYIECSKFY